MNKRRLSWLLAIVMLFVMAVPNFAATATTTAPTAPVTTAVVAPEGTKTTIDLLATSDLHGRIYAYEYAIDEVDPDAGFAKLQTAIKAERAANKNVVLMDIGDTVQDNSADLFNDRPIHPMVDAMNYMKFDTWTLGNHEFNFEKAFLDKNIKAFKNTVLSANIFKDNKTPYVNPYKIVVRDGVRIAIVGVTPPHIPRWEASSPSHYKGLTFTEPMTEVRKVLKKIKGQYDVLVGAFHLGEEGEYGSLGAYSIAMEMPEFDVIFMGHSHARVSGKVVNGVTLLEPGAYGWALSKAEVSLTMKNGKWEVDAVKPSNIETMKLEEDQEILARYKDVHEASIKDANIVIGKVTEDFVKGVDYITGDSKVTTMPRIQIEDSALIDLINEVQTFYTKSDVSAAAAFSSNMNLLKGDFKKKDAANIYKYSNTLMGVNITGKNLKAYMEWSANYYNKSNPNDVTVSFDPNVRGYNYDMFSGVNYDIDISKEKGKRIVNATIKGQPIEDTKIYKLAVNNYRFGTLTSLNLVTKNDVYYDSYREFQDNGRIRELISMYLQKQKGGTATPAVDNNWKIIGFDFNHPKKAEVFELIIKGAIKIPVSDDGRTPNVKALNVDDLKAKGLLK